MEQLTIKRRTLAAGAAWAAPAVAVASAAPAFAASPCLTVPDIESNSWSKKEQDVNTKPFRYINGGRTIEAIVDWAWWATKPRPEWGYAWAWTSLPVQAGYEYTLKLDMQTCYGYNWPGPGSPGDCGTNTTRFRVFWEPGASGTPTVSGLLNQTPVFLGTTQHWNGYELLSPPVNCNGPLTNRPTKWSSYTRLVKLVVPCGSLVKTARLTFMFTASPHGRVKTPGNGGTSYPNTQFSNQNNDDWRVTPTVIDCKKLSC